MAESVSYKNLDTCTNLGTKNSMEEKYEEAWDEQEITSFELCETIPIPAPTYSGNDLHLNPELVIAGFSAISIKHQPTAKHYSKGCKLTNYSHSGPYKDHQRCHNPESVQPRNAYCNLHHPDLMNLTWARGLTPEDRKEVIEKYFHEHASYHEPFCSSFHSSKLLPTSQPNLIKERITENEGNFFCPSAGSKLQSFEVVDGDAKQKELDLMDDKNDVLEIIMAPTPIHDTSTENTMWNKDNVKATNQPSSDILQALDLRWGTGSGEEEEIEAIGAQSNTMGNLGLDSEGQMMEIMGEAGATINTPRVNERDLGLLKMLHRSPAIMHIATQESMATQQEQRFLETKDMVTNRSLHKGTKHKMDKEEQLQGCHSVVGGGKVLFRSNFSTHEPIITEGSTWQSNNCSDILINTKKSMESEHNDQWNDKESIDSIQWERSTEWILPHKNTDKSN